MNLTDSNQALVTLAMQIISMRLLMILTLLLNAGFVSWAMWSESWIRLAGAVVFALASWCIVNLKPPERMSQ